MKNIVLCGFMGCGKSTVGKQLAEQLHMTFVDMDAYIEELDGRTIPAIFAQDGETAFRTLEHNACVTLGSQCNLVIATGGGAVLRADNVTALSANGILVFLDVSAATVLDRLRDDTSRPLLQRPDKDTAVYTLMQQRAPLYCAAADITVNGDGDAPTVAAAVIEQLPTD